MKTTKCAAAVSVCVIGITTTGTGVAASASPIAGSDSDAINAASSPRTSRYIEASSPEEADQKLASLERGGAMAQAANVQYGPCTLYPTPTYLRTSSDRKNVGAKPRTVCSVPVTSINHASDLRYKSFIWWRKAGPTHTGGNRGVAKCEQKNVEYRCVSSEQTGWTGTTAGTIVYAGKTYYARVYFDERSLACGG
ncbi:hypothetical protein [uncultured Arsenicicoccus sp.]|uniref:hypothetical protein n=1 Tax=uncultured Arsenicicoccus sp. TaxID=491339 RepID=UPI002595F22C|nr:hypothetical protein [uncultured Arsenicicoccus sp.]